MAHPLRDRLRELLARADFEGLIELAARKQNIARRLIAMTYDRDDVLSWRAMEAVGRIGASLPPDEGRELIQRILWMMREESGTNAWSAPYILGEMLRENPGPYGDIVPVLVSFHEEGFFTAGVLWAMHRIAERWPDLIEPYSDLAEEYAASARPLVRGYAAMVLRTLGKPFAREIFIADETEVPVYRNAALLLKSLGEIATEAIDTTARNRA